MIRRMCLVKFPSSLRDSKICYNLVPAVETAGYYHVDPTGRGNKRTMDYYPTDPTDRICDGADSQCSPI